MPPSQKPDLFLVASARAATMASGEARRDRFWVSWLGYPEQRSCWRTPGKHFLDPSLVAPPVEASADAAAAAAVAPTKSRTWACHVCTLENTATRCAACGEARPKAPPKPKPPPKPEAEAPPPPEDRAFAAVEVRLLEAPDEALGPTLKGRPVPDVAASKESRGELKKKQPAKRKRVEYEQRVHKIRVEANGKISEIREIRRRGGNGTTTTTVEEDGDGAASTSTEAAGGSSSGGAAAARDEQSELWAQHRLLNEAVYARRHGGALRVEVGDDWSADAVTLKWVFPLDEGSPGDCSAWVGMYDAGEFDWPAGAPRPRYEKYKALTSSKAEGTLTFSSGFWKGIGDGEYLFSIDSGSLAACAGASHLYPVSQRIRLEGGRVVAVVGAAHGASLPPKAADGLGAARLANFGVGTGNKKAPPPGSDEESDEEAGSEEEEEEPRLMFAVPLLELDEDVKEESADVRQAYAMVDRLSYLDWGLNTRDVVTGKREARVSAAAEWAGCKVHSGELWAGSEAGSRKNLSEKEGNTSRTSEGYGEATCATAERLIRVLCNLTRYIPSMSGWDEAWNLSTDSSFLDIGSGYGKVVLHAKLAVGCRHCHGIECVPKRVEISNGALQGLFSELDRAALANDLLKGVSFDASDACAAASHEFSHIYVFDRVFSRITLEALATVLERSNFYVMVSSKTPRTWWECGLTKVQPVAKMRFVTTGRERMTCFVYVNAHFIPGFVRPEQGRGAF